jgi:tRNA G46 methylase TrmB
MATLFGMRPAPLDGCRVLELACAGGGNLIPLALQLPRATILGVDLSARELAEGQVVIDALALTIISRTSTSRCTSTSLSRRPMRMACNIWAKPTIV